MKNAGFPITSQKEFDFFINKTLPRLLPAILSGLGIKQVAQTITSASYTLTNDASKFFIMNSASAQTFNIPQNLTAWEVGSVLTIIQIGDGLVTVDPGTGVTINGDTTNVASTGKWKTLQLIKISTNGYVVAGDAV